MLPCRKHTLSAVRACFMRVRMDIVDAHEALTPDTLLLAQGGGAPAAAAPAAYATDKFRFGSGGAVKTTIMNDGAAGAASSGAGGAPLRAPPPPRCARACMKTQRLLVHVHGSAAAHLA